MKLWVGRMGPFKQNLMVSKSVCLQFLDSFNNSCTMGVCFKRHV